MNPRPLALLHLVGHFLWQSVRAGVDVALRAFNPRLPLKTGTITYHLPIAPGVGRDLFTAMTSLLPGTVPLGPPLRPAPPGVSAAPGDAALDSIDYHCLDVEQPIVPQLDREATLLIAALGIDSTVSHGPSGRAPTDHAPAAGGAQ